MVISAQTHNTNAASYPSLQSTKAQNMLLLGGSLGCCALGPVSRGFCRPTSPAPSSLRRVIRLIVNERSNHARKGVYGVQYRRPIGPKSQPTHCCCEQRLRHKTTSSNYPLRPFRGDVSVRCESSFNSHLHLLLLHPPPPPAMARPLHMYRRRINRHLE